MAGWFSRACANWKERRQKALEADQAKRIEQLGRQMIEAGCADILCITDQARIRGHLAAADTEAKEALGRILAFCRSIGIDGILINTEGLRTHPDGKGRDAVIHLACDRLNGIFPEYQVIAHPRRLFVGDTVELET